MNPQTFPLRERFWPARLQEVVEDPRPYLRSKVGVSEFDANLMISRAREGGTSVALVAGHGESRLWVFVSAAEDGVRWTIHAAAAATECATEADAEEVAVHARQAIGGDWAVIRHEGLDFAAMGWVKLP